MGNKNCEALKSQTQENQAYGQFQIIEENNKAYAKIVKVIQMQNDSRKSIASSLQKRNQLQQEGLCKHEPYQGHLHSFHIEEFPSVIEVTLKYEYLPTSLFEKKQQIFSSNQYFSQNQLNKMMQLVSKGLKQLYKNRIRHGCINLHTILCSQNTYKITDVSSTSYMTLIELVQKGSKNQPISYKIIKMINQGIFRQRCKKQITIQDDLFSLGMVILSLGTNTELSQFYDFQAKGQRHQIIELKEKVIDDYLFLLRKKYSKDLQKQVRKLIFQAKQPQQSYLSKVTTQIRDNTQTIRNSDLSINIQSIQQTNLSIKF